MDPTTTSGWTALISQLGFPIFVCIWFMWRDYKFLTALQDVLGGVKEEIGKLNILIEAVVAAKK
jgi:hypothetical protein